MAGSLAAGNYTVTVTDANGCTETQGLTVLEPIVLSSTVSSMNALCNGSSDGSATVSSAGGTAPYTYLWDDGQTTAMAGSLAAGNYTVTVTDANGCTENQSVTVLEPTPILVTSISQISPGPTCSPVPGNTISTITPSSTISGSSSIVSVAILPKSAVA